MIEHGNMTIHLVLLDTRWGYDKETDTRLDEDQI